MRESVKFRALRCSVEVAGSRPRGTMKHRAKQVVPQTARADFSSRSLASIVVGLVKADDPVKTPRGSSAALG